MQQRDAFIFYTVSNLNRLKTTGQKLYKQLGKKSLNFQGMLEICCGFIMPYPLKSLEIL